MKVKEISQVIFGDTLKYKISFEGQDKPMYASAQPAFGEGHEIPDDSVQLSQSGKSYIMKRTSTQAGSPQAKAPPKFVKTSDDIIMLQVAFKGAVELEGYWFVPDGKAHADRVLQNTAELFAGLLLIKPNK